MNRPLPPHTDAGNAAITAELVRLTLPHHPSTDRGELWCDLEALKRIGIAYKTRSRRRRG